MLVARTRVWPGLTLCLGFALLSYGLQWLLPAVSPLLVAIIAGALLTNLRPLPQRFEPGLKSSAKRVLRLGVVLLGLQLSLQQILGLGLRGLGVVVAVVGGGVAGTLLIGRLLKVPATQRVLIACGFSICGAAAVAAVESAVDADEEDTACAVGLVVLYGTLMIGVAPLLVAVLGLTDEQSGVAIGGMVHEVAQVVAAGGIVGGSALAVATVVKLARVLMLGPVVLAITAYRRAHSDTTGGTQPPLVPLFVAGFFAAILVRSFVPLPDAVFAGGKAIQTILLAAAMFALGTGVRVDLLRRVGARPIVLGLLSTILVSAIALGGVFLTR
jgi:uncharacterized integral membrane protein (TIGR00698 family)